jgi:hypothetical protein
LKKIIAIFFLFSFLSANTTFGQLLKLPVLFQHYSLHSSGHADADHEDSFLNFVADHYSHPESTPGNSSHDHKDLPLKSTDIPAISQAIALPLYDYFTIATPSFAKEVHKSTFVRQYYSSASLGSIWQPPRFS